MLIDIWCNLNLLLKYTQNHEYDMVVRLNMYSNFTQKITVDLTKFTLVNLSEGAYELRRL